MSKICLSMIVKNEAHCIKRCLQSLKPFISHWVICDTGSTDGTQEIIKEYLKDIPGELIQNEWIDFSTNRNIALNAAYDKADYVLFIDADDYLSVSNQDALKNLTDPVYALEISYNTISYQRPHIIRNDIKCEWVGVLHEYLKIPQGVSAKLLENVKIIIAGAGSRSKDPKKYLNDALLLEKALEKEPFNDRYAFYCAQSYRDYSYQDNKYIKKSIDFYNKRISMGGWIEEQYISALEIGKLLERSGIEDINIIESAYLRAYNILPHRNEALTYLSAFCRKRNLFDKTYFYAKIASNIKKPVVGLFIEPNCYDWKALDELAISAFYIGKKQEALNINTMLINSKKIPENEIKRIKNNLNFCK